MKRKREFTPAIKKQRTPKTKPAPKRQVVYRPLEALIPYARNARTHSDEQVAQIAASIREFGWTNPVLVDEQGGIIAGHGRVLAARKLGLTEAPTIELDGLTDAQRRAYVLADNKLALNAGWDDEMLKLEIGGLDASDFDLALTGFSAAEIDALLSVKTEVGVTDDDAPVEPPENPATVKGDLWVLGAHRLLCGDCTVPTDVERLMDGKTAVLMNTDPPYGVDYAAVKKGIPGFSMNSGGEVENDGLTDGAALQEFLEDCIRTAVPYLRDNAAFYLWHPMLTQGTFFAAAAAAAADILIHRQIIWVKPGLVLTRSGMYHWKHELCFYGWRRGHMPPWYGDKSQVSVWEVGKDENQGVHPTQKPVELFVRPIANHSREGEVIYEPFSGSGSQIIAAEKTGRRCYATEISPRYVDAAVKRWQDFTGKQATLEGDGRTFAEVAKERA